MRCWHPRANKVINEVKAYSPEEVILLHLYPQFSAATSGSSIKEWTDICIKNNFKVKTSTICCYPTDANFIEAHTVEIKKKINIQQKPQQYVAILQIVFLSKAT